MKKLALTTALALAALAGARRGEGPSRPRQPGQGAGRAGQVPAGQGRKCTAHGAPTSSGHARQRTLTANPDGTYDGTLTVKVAQANHHAKADRTTSRTYTLDHARVNLHGQDPPRRSPAAA